MYKSPGSGVAVGTGIGSLAATGAGIAWWVVAGAVLLVAGLVLLRASRRRRAAADE
ncbi:LPXTG cell wall anchor domain-containing protein [Actinosynnema sp. NPDC051121]|nr:LPXTG cell wall anchor domain-containing protein [Saccharothrix sp.]